MLRLKIDVETQRQKGSTKKSGIASLVPCLLIRDLEMIVRRLNPFARQIDTHVLRRGSLAIMGFRFLNVIDGLPFEKALGEYSGWFQ
jgi:hypothetical protein